MEAGEAGDSASPALAAGAAAWGAVSVARGAMVGLEERVALEECPGALVVSR